MFCEVKVSNCAYLQIDSEVALCLKKKNHNSLSSSVLRSIIQVLMKWDRTEYCVSCAGIQLFKIKAGIFFPTLHDSQHICYSNCLSCMHDKLTQQPYLMLPTFPSFWWDGTKTISPSLAPSQPLPPLKIWDMTMEVASGDALPQFICSTPHENSNCGLVCAGLFLDESCRGSVASSRQCCAILGALTVKLYPEWCKW